MLIRRIFAVVFSIGLTANLAFAQNISLKYVEYVSNKIVIHYDLLDSVESRYFTIRLYSSVDGFLNPLEKIEGDGGLEVKSGKNKQIIWDASRELGIAFEGRVSLEIRGRVFIPFINTEDFKNYKTFKRNRKYNITWSGGTPQNILNFDLYRGEKKITSFPNLANVGHHVLEFPAYVRPGNGYRFKISDSKNRDDVVFTGTFRIRRKIPLAIKAVPILAIGASTYLLLHQPAAEQSIGDPILPTK